MTNVFSLAARTAGVALALLAVGCESGPSIKRALTIHDADAVEVTFWSGKSGQRLVLRNTTAAVRAAEAKADKHDARLSAREVSSEQMQKLLDGLATCDFFRLAARPQGAGSMSSLTVSVNGRQHAVSSMQTSAEDMQKWAECVQFFNGVYNVTGGYEVKELKGDERQRVLDDMLEKLTPEERERARKEIEKAGAQPTTRPRSDGTK